MRASVVAAATVLKQACTRSGLSQRELARRAGVSQSVIAVYANAAREPSLATLAGLVEATGISPDLQLTADLPSPARTAAQSGTDCGGAAPLCWCWCWQSGPA